MFLGSFLGCSIDTTPIDSGTTEYIEIENGIFDEVYMDSNTDIPFDTKIPEWGYTTILDAKFKNNILAGNVDFTLDTVSNMRFKKRRKDDYKWVTIHNVPITKESDFDIFYNDVVVASTLTYQYAAVPIINGVEGTYQIIDVDVQFDGCFIIDPTNTYQIILNLKRDSLSRSIPANIIETAHSKYPFVHHYAETMYDKFSVSGTFIELDRANCFWDTKRGWKYRESIRDYLCNRRAKILKFYNGEMYLVNIVDQITESENGHPENMITTINAVECGDVMSNSDLYYHGFTNYLEVGV